MFQRVGPKAFKKDLNNILHLSNYLGDPHQSFKSVHIAGTNGKGSTSFFIATALHAMGYKVGLYTSPHYKDYRERIKVDGVMIDKKYVKKFVIQLISDDILSGNFKPSFFEITVGMAFSYFKEKEVDFAIVETGLGGRLDSTNIITPEISVITNIGFDHVQFLGNTLALIAAEKAGIIKPSVPVIIGRNQKETHAVFKKIAKQNKAPLHYAPELPAIEVSKKLLNSFPDYQKENLQTAYSCLNTLVNKVSKTKLSKAWTEGLKEWGYMGRYMKVGHDPLTIYDSAHNIDGVTILFDELKNEKYDQLHIILAMVGDKDQSKVLQLFPKDAHYYFSQASIPRAMDKKKLSVAAQEHDLTGRIYSTVRKALSAAHKRANKNDLVLVAGSIFTVAEVV